MTDDELIAALLGAAGVDAGARVGVIGLGRDRHGVRQAVDASAHLVVIDELPCVHLMPGLLADAGMTHLLAPALDARAYDELLAEARARIPIHNPEWTNQQDSDPGVTLLELVAFLGENLLYGFHRIPERSRADFLRLLGCPDDCDHDDP